MDTTNQYHRYKDYAQLSVKQLSLKSSLVSASSQSGEHINEDVLKGKQLIFIDDIAINSQTAKTRALWESNYRLAKSKVYTCVVAGHTYDGRNAWMPNTLVEIYDEPATICSCRRYLL